MPIKRTIEQVDPKQFGYQPNGTYAPGPAEIAKHCALIRKHESDKQLQSRAMWAYSTPLVVRELFSESSD